MKSFVMGSAGALAMVVLLIGVAVAADIFTVDRNGNIRFGISDTGAARLTAADNANPALNVTQSGTGPAAVISGGNVAIGTTSASDLLTVGKTDGTTGGHVVVNPQAVTIEGGEIVLVAPPEKAGNNIVLDNYDGRFRVIRTNPGGAEVVSVLQNGNVGIGTLPGASNLLEVSSTTKGFVMPRMTKAQRNAIASPIAGMQIYQTDNTPGVRIYNGTNWMRYTESID